MSDAAPSIRKISILHDIIEFIRSLHIRNSTFQHGRVQEELNENPGGPVEASVTRLFGILESHFKT